MHDDMSTTSNPSRLSFVDGAAGGELVVAHAGGVHAHRVGRDRVGDVGPARVHVHRMRLADVAGQPDRLRVVDVGHVDDLEPALRRAADAEGALVVAAPGSVGGVEQDLRVAPVGVEHVGVEDRAALRRRLDVVLEARRGRRVAEAGGRRVGLHRARGHACCRWSAGRSAGRRRWADAERAHRRVDVPFCVKKSRSVCGLPVGKVAIGLPRGAAAAGDEGGRGGPGGRDAHARVVEQRSSPWPANGGSRRCASDATKTARTTSLRCT